jgi:multidrug efflux pump subunit AcrB
MRLITASSLKSPATIAAGLVLTVVFGILSLSQLPVELLPDIARPQIGIRTDWRAQTPREVEAQIVEPEEQVLQGTPGLRQMEGHAGFGEAHIDLTFPLGTNMDRALSDVVARLNRIQTLPTDAQKPLAQLVDSNDRNSLLLSVFLQQLPASAGDLSGNVRFIRDSVVPTLQAVQGVGTVQFTGDGVADELQILFNPIRAAQLNIQIPKLASQIGESDDISAGTLDVGRYKLGISFRGRYSDDQLKDTVLDWRSGNPILLRDIANIRVGQARREGFAYYNGRPAIEIDVFRAAGANVLATVKNIKTELDSLNAGDAKARGVVLRYADDATPFIRRTLSLAGFDVLLGIVLAICALRYFLQEWRATLVAAAAIPISLFAVMILLRVSGRSLNVVSLAACAVSIGMILDASIVVLENILRLRESGAPVAESAHDGTHQVWRALFASTVTNMAIFLPVMFLEDVEGQLYSTFAIPIIFAILVSFVVAIAVVPVASVHFMKTDVRTDRLSPAWSRMAGRAMSLTESPRERRWWIASLIAISVAGSWLLFPAVHYLPQVQRGAVRVALQYPPGSTEEHADRDIAQPLIRRLAPYGSSAGPIADWYLNADLAGKMQMTLWTNGRREAARMERILRTDILKGLPDAVGFASEDDLFEGFDQGRAVSIDIQSQDTGAMRAAARTGFEAISTQFPGAVIETQPGLDYDQPQLELRPNDRAIAETGWTRADLSNLVQALGEGLYIGQRFEDGEQLYLILKSATSTSPAALQNTPVATPQGNVTYLGRLVSFRRTLDAGGILTLNGLQTFALNIQPPANVAPADMLATIRRDIEPRIRSALPADGSITYGAVADDLSTALGSIGEIIAIAVLILLAIMAALFRSLRDAAIAVVGLPLGCVGGVLAIRLLNFVVSQPLDLFTLIGFIVVIGLGVNNTILLVARTREAEAEGMTRDAAVRSSLETRLRPICTGTLAVVAGMLPLLVIPGSGVEIYRGLGAVIIGGVLVSHVFTVILIPALLRIGEWRLDAKTQMLRSWLPGKPVASKAPVR